MARHSPPSSIIHADNVVEPLSPLSQLVLTPGDDSDVAPPPPPSDQRYNPRRGQQSASSYPVQSERSINHNRRHHLESHPPVGYGASTVESNSQLMSMMMDSTQYSNPKHFNAYTGAKGSSRSPPRGDKRNNNASSATTNKENSANHSSSSSSPKHDVMHSQLTQKLSQYTRGSDRRQVLRSLMDPKLLPRMHTLKNVWVEDIAAAEREAAGERASLNGVKFLQVKNVVQDETDYKKPVDSYFLQTLREICGHMCDMDGVDADPMALYGGLLLRLSRSVSERDALEVVTQWSCGKGELVVLPLKKRHHDPSCRLPDPIDVELYVESGNVHAKVTMRHELGVYRRTDLESHGLKQELSPWNALIMAREDISTQSSSTKKLTQIQYEALGSPNFTNMKPWIFIDADVVERINFGTGSSVRILHVNLPEDKNSGYVKKW